MGGNEIIKVFAVNQRKEAGFCPIER